MSKNYNVYYLLAYRIYRDSIVVKSLTDGWFGILPKSKWNGKKICIITGKAYRSGWGYRFQIIEVDKEPTYSEKTFKIFNELKRKIELKAELFNIIELLKKLAEEKFISMELEDLLNTFWNAEEYAIYEGYRRKNAWILWFIKEYGIDFSDTIESYTFDEWNDVRKLIIKFKKEKLDETKKWLLLRMVFRYNRRGSEHRRMEITEEHIVNHWPAISVLFPQLVDFIKSNYPVAIEKIPKIWGDFYAWNIDFSIRSSSPIYAATSKNIENADFLIEVDLPRLVYYGILGQAFEEWDEIGYPRKVYYFIRDSPLSFDILPGDLILAKLRMIWGSEIYVLEPLEKVTIKRALQIIECKKNIRVVAFDKPLDLYKKLLEDGVKVLNYVLYELEHRKPILDKVGFNIVARRIRQYIINLQDRLANNHFNLLKENLKIENIDNALELFSILMPDKTYFLKSIGLTNKEIFEIIREIMKDKHNYLKLREEFLDSVKIFLERLILSDTHRNWNVKKLAEMFPDIAMRLIELRINEIKNAEVTVEQCNKEKYYDVEKLTRTYYGEKIVKALFGEIVRKVPSQKYIKRRSILNKLKTLIKNV